jgi:hypothetical protein
MVMIAIAAMVMIAIAAMVVIAIAAMVVIAIGRGGAPTIKPSRQQSWSRSGGAA